MPTAVENEKLPPSASADASTCHACSPLYTGYRYYSDDYTHRTQQLEIQNLTEGISLGQRQIRGPGFYGKFGSVPDLNNPAGIAGYYWQVSEVRRCGVNRKHLSGQIDLTGASCNFALQCTLHMHTTHTHTLSPSLSGTLFHTRTHTHTP